MGRLAGAWLGAWLLLPGPAPASGVTDDSGSLVALGRPAERIVTLSPHATELVISAGAADRLVGIAPAPSIPPALSALPRVGGPGALDRETLLGLQPDLVVAWQSGNRAADLDWLARSGIAVYRSEPATLDDIAASIRALGELAGTTDVAAAAAEAFDRALQTPCTRLPPIPAFVLAWERPPISFGGRHWINDVLRAAGFRNHFKWVNSGAFQVAPEALLAAEPAVRISLAPQTGGGDQALADVLARPGPYVAEAVHQLCARRLRLAPLR